MKRLIQNQSQNKSANVCRCSSPAEVSGESNLIPGIKNAILAHDQAWANRLETSEFVRQCEPLSGFLQARHEWFRAWEIFLRRPGQRQLLPILLHEGASFPAAKSFILWGLSQKNDAGPSLLRNTASVIHRAALQGDLNFFREIGYAFRSRDRTKPNPAPIEGCVLNFWFSGLLWLMNAEVGAQALEHYVQTTRFGRSVVRFEAYKKARSHLKLRGYRCFSPKPLITAYHPKQRNYVWATDWETKLEPRLSR